MKVVFEGQRVEINWGEQQEKTFWNDYNVFVLPAGWVKPSEYRLWDLCISSYVNITPKEMKQSKYWTLVNAIHAEVLRGKSTYAIYLEIDLKGRSADGWLVRERNR